MKTNVNKSKIKTALLNFENIKKENLKRTKEKFEKVNRIVLEKKDFFITDFNTKKYSINIDKYIFDKLSLHKTNLKYKQNLRIILVNTKLSKIEKNNTNKQTEDE